MVECSKAAFPVTVADQIPMVDDTGKGAKPAGKCPFAEFCLPADEQGECHCQEVTDHDGGNVKPSEGDGRGLKTELQVIIPVCDGIFRVIGKGPEDIGGQQQPCCPWDGFQDSGICHRDAESESQAKPGLGKGEEPLEQGVNPGDECCHDRKSDGQAVEREDQQERHKSQDGGDPKRFYRLDLSGCQYPVLGPFDLTVNIPVQIVVDGTACRAH